MKRATKLQPAQAIKVAAAAGAATYRKLHSSLKNNDLTCVLGNAGNILELRSILSLGPDVVVVDLDIDDRKQIPEIIHNVRCALPKAVFLFVSTHTDLSIYNDLVNTAHCWSYLSKSLLDDAELLAKVIQSASRGLIFLDAHSLTVPAVKFRPPIKNLTPQQHRVLKLMAEGWSNDTIAKRLCISKRTVENMIRSIYNRLGIDTSDKDSHPRVLATLKYLARR